ncbi:MAG: DUF5685 family protein [Acutalibacteraceae bacterium]
MFGYVRIFKPDLKMREFDQYQGVYCTLCRRLGKKYGFTARMTLSYDFTFLALFLMAFDEECPVFSKGHCSFHPFKKRLCCGGENGTPAIEYAADVAMLLTYGKLTDSLEDEGLFGRMKARVGKLLTARAYRKAAACRPDEAQAVQQYLERQRTLEKVHTACVDAAAEPTALLLSRLASNSLPLGVPTETAARFGYCLGRFIYLADAADDLEKDIKSGNYNPYAAMYALEKNADEKTLATVRSYASESLYACVAACVESYEQLPVKRFDGILRNVLFCGMPYMIRQIKTPSVKKEQEG